MCRNPYVPQISQVLDIHRETAVDWTFRLAWDAEPAAGQFFEVSLPGLGEAPISVSDFGPGYIEMTIRKVGRVTGGLFALAPGERLFLRGPYGCGFPLERFAGRHLVIAAGGTGVAPVKPVIKHFLSHGEGLAGLDVLIGFKSPHDILFRQEVLAWQSRAGVVLTVDHAEAGWTGPVGLVTQTIPDLPLPDKANVAAIVVGPPAMMKHTIAALQARGLQGDQIWVSYERRMSCGLGKCGHCKINDKYVCLEGPVFSFAQAQGLKD
ncbi:MAG: anaerobic sulfite reductase subunit AsrB [Planctomycetaceae bacterium]|nr:anaerobic sulfite reductase subunit AsrB [Planctomycetaceae bacterium]